MNKILHTLFLVILFINYFACTAQEKDATANIRQNASPTGVALDTVRVFHTSLPLHIPFEAQLQYGKKSVLRSMDRAKVVAVLIDPGQRVKKNALLFSLWLMGQKQKELSRDILAPISGMVKNVYVRPGQIVSPNSMLALVVDYKFLKMTLQINNRKLKYIRIGQKVVLTNVGDQMIGYVRKISGNGQIQIIFRNTLNAHPVSHPIPGYIDCGPVKGDYIKNDWFAKKDLINVFIDDESNFPVYTVGISDSLTLLSEPLPYLDTILVMQNHSLPAK